MWTVFLITEVVITKTFFNKFLPQGENGKEVGSEMKESSSDLEILGFL